MVSPSFANWDSQSSEEYEKAEDLIEAQKVTEESAKGCGSFECEGEKLRTLKRGRIADIQ